MALITLGATFAPAILASPVAMAIWAYDPRANAEVAIPAAVALAEGLLGLAMIWGGFRPRRMPESAVDFAVQSDCSR